MSSVLLSISFNDNTYLQITPTQGGGLPDPTKPSNPSIDPSSPMHDHHQNVDHIVQQQQQQQQRQQQQQQRSSTIPLKLQHLPLRQVHMSRVGQNRISAPYMTVCMVISLLRIPYVHRIYL